MLAKSQDKFGRASWESLISKSKAKREAAITRDRGRTRGKQTCEINKIQSTILTAVTFNVLYTSITLMRRYNDCTARGAALTPAVNTVTSLLTVIGK